MVSGKHNNKQRVNNKQKQGGGTPAPGKKHTLPDKDKKTKTKGGHPLSRVKNHTPLTHTLF